MHHARKAQMQADFLATLQDYNILDHFHPFVQVRGARVLGLC